MDGANLPSEAEQQVAQSAIAVPKLVKRIVPRPHCQGLSHVCSDYFLQARSGHVFRMASRST